MLPLPTSKRLWISAYWDYMGLTEEEHSELVSSVEGEWEQQALMLQGGKAGIAVNDYGDIITFGDCAAVLKMYEIARDVYDYPFESQENLCQAFR